MPLRRIIITAATGALVVGGAGVTALQVRENVIEKQGRDKLAAICADINREISERGAVQRLTNGSTEVVLLGDSYAAADFLADPSQGWATALGESQDWTLNVDAIGGTGFINGGPCAAQNFGSRIEQAIQFDPEVLVVQGGLNDHQKPADAITESATQLLAETETVETVVVIGPANTPGVEVEPAIDDALREATEAAGRTYISALGWDDLTYQKDGLHLTPEGHAAYAEHVAAALP